MATESIFPCEPRIVLNAGIAFFPLVRIVLIPWILSVVILRFFAPETPKSPASPWQLAQCNKYSSFPIGTGSPVGVTEGEFSLHANSTPVTKTKLHPNVREKAMEYLQELILTL